MRKSDISQLTFWMLFIVVTLPFASLARDQIRGLAAPYPALLILVWVILLVFSLPSILITIHIIGGRYGVYDPFGLPRLWPVLCNKILRSAPPSLAPPCNEKQAHDITADEGYVASHGSVSVK